LIILHENTIAKTAITYPLYLFYSWDFLSGLCEFEK